MTKKRKQKAAASSAKGFTLIEILVVVALIAILATLTIVAINPAQNFADTRNTERSTEINNILNGVTQYTSKQGNAIGDFGSITACATGASNIGTGAGNVNLATLLVPDFIVAIPTDPQGGTDADTGYDICLTSGSRVEIRAPNAEDGASISVQR